MRGGVDPKYMDKQITLYNRPTTPSNETAAAVPDLRPVWRVPNEPASAAAVGVVVVEVAAVVVPQDLTANSPGGCLQYQQVQRTTTSTSLLSFRFRLRGCGRCSGGLSPRCFASPCRRRTMFLRPRRCTSGAYTASTLIPTLIPDNQRPLAPQPSASTCVFRASAPPPARPQLPTCPAPGHSTSTPPERPRRYLGAAASARRTPRSQTPQQRTPLGVAAWQTSRPAWPQCSGSGAGHRTTVVPWVPLH